MKTLHGLVIFLILAVFMNTPAFANVNDSFCCNQNPGMTAIGYATPESIDRPYTWTVGLSPVGLIAEKYGKNDPRMGYSNSESIDQTYNWSVGLSPVGVMVEKYRKNDSSWILDVKPHYKSVANIFDFLIRLTIGAIFGLSPPPLSDSQSISLSYKKMGLFNSSGGFYRAGVEYLHIYNPGDSYLTLINLTMGYEFRRGHSVLGMEVGYDSVPINFWYRYRF